MCFSWNWNSFFSGLTLDHPQISWIYFFFMNLVFIVNCFFYFSNFCVSEGNFYQGMETTIFFLISTPSTFEIKIWLCFLTLQFLVADTQLYKRLCPSVRWSVGLSVRNDWVGKCENAHLRPCPPVRNCFRPCFTYFLLFTPTCSGTHETRLQSNLRATCNRNTMADWTTIRNRRTTNNN